MRGMLKITGCDPLAVNDHLPDNDFGFNETNLGHDEIVNRHHRRRPYDEAQGCLELLVEKRDVGRSHWECWRDNGWERGKANVGSKMEFNPRWQSLRMETGQWRRGRMEVAHDMTDAVPSTCAVVLVQNIIYPQLDSPTNSGVGYEATYC